MDQLLASCLGLFALGLIFSSGGEGGAHEGRDPEREDEKESELDHEETGPPGDNSDQSTISISGATASGKIVPAELFGANVIWGVNTEDGLPKPAFTDALEQLDIDQLRFPSGKGDGDADDEGKTWFNVVTLGADDDGNPQLSDDLTQLLDWARDPDHDGDTPTTYKLKLVIPTRHLAMSEYDEFASEIYEFSRLISRDYPDVVSAFEIGNEYYNRMTETDYGGKANIAIRALVDGMRDAGMEEDCRPDILVQMGYPNASSEFSEDHDARGYMARLQASNQQIIDQIDPDARKEIDGVVGHYYLDADGRDLDELPSQTNFLEQRYAIWAAQFDQHLGLHITEWNSATESDTQGGISSAPIMATQIRSMIEMGASSADVWPVQHNTINDLAGGRDEEVDLDEQGRVVNSVNGAIFDLMSSNLPGLELIDIDFDRGDGGFDIFALQGQDRTVVYIYSTGESEVNFSLDLTDLLHGEQIGRGTLVSVDPASSDGLRYKAGTGMVEADYILIDGERYYCNEQDAQAMLQELQYAGTIVPVHLRPYELLQIDFLYV